jgi:predicted metal-dependent phosphoesterase TrpH
MLKVELHAHTDHDPVDHIPHSTGQLIERAASLGYGALAVTLHDRYFDPAPWRELASRRRLVLLPGIERTIEGCHMLLINFPATVAEVSSFDDLRRLKSQSRGLVVAPHPFYPIGTAAGASLTRHADLVDAVEINSVYTRWLDFNGRAVRWARTHDKPLVGATDLHLLDQMGTTFSLVNAAPDPDAICDAIRAGRIEVHTKPLSTGRAVSIVVRMLLTGARGWWRHLRGRAGRVSSRDAST